MIVELAVGVVLTALVVAGQPSLELAPRWVWAVCCCPAHAIGSVEVLGGITSHTRPSKNKTKKRAWGEVMYVSM